MFLEQRLAMRAFLELRQLISWQRRVELVHDLRIGMATRTKISDPCTIFLAIFLRPFLDEIVTEIGRGIAAVATGTGKAAPKMNVFDHFLQIHVCRRLARVGRHGKEIFR